MGEEKFLLGEKEFRLAVGLTFDNFLRTNDGVAKQADSCGRLPTAGAYYAENGEVWALVLQKLIFGYPRKSALRPCWHPEEESRGSNDTGTE